MAICLPAECMAGLAFDTEAADHEKSACVFFIDGFVNAGGHIEITEIFSTKSTGCGFEAGQGNARDFFSAYRIELTDAGTMAKRDPQLVILIDRHAIRRGVEMSGGNYRALVVQGAFFVVERQNFSARCIDVIDRFAIATPADAVRVRHRTVGFGDAEIGRETIEISIARFLDQAYGSGEKVSVW